MVDQKISDLDPATLPLNAADQFEVVQGGSNKRVPSSGVADPLLLTTDYSTTTPSAPTTGVKMFSRTLAGRRRPAFVGPSGLDTGLQALLGANKVGIWSANGNGTGVFTMNFGASNTGTPAARNVANTNRSTMMRGLRFPAGTGSTCGTRHNLLQFNRDAGFEYIARLGIGALPSSGFHTILVGLVGTTSAVSQIGGGVAAGVGLRLISGSVGDGWNVVSAALTADAVTTHQVLSQTDFPVNTANVDMYEIRLFCAPGGSSVGWSVTRLTGGSGQMATGEMTTALPASNVLLSPIIQGSTQNNSSGYAIDIVSQYIETDL